MNEHVEILRSTEEMLEGLIDQGKQKTKLLEQQNKLLEMLVSSQQGVKQQSTPMTPGRKNLRLLCQQNLGVTEGRVRRQTCPSVPSLLYPFLP